MSDPGQEREALESFGRLGLGKGDMSDLHGQERDVQVVVDFLEAWRYCPVASSPNPARQCLEDAAGQLLAALAAREDTEQEPK